MKLEEFRQLVKAEFGDGLKHATPANVREFLDRLQDDKIIRRAAHRLVVDDPCNSPEEVFKDFFAQVLKLAPEEAVVALWTLALDLSFAMIESQYSDKLASLFQDTD